MLPLLVMMSWGIISIIGVIGLLKKDFILVILNELVLLMPTPQTTSFSLPNAES